ncbi:MAG: hypothetical protein IJK60_00660 [Clostridia bacterium]|nr:hypothetical protein [Clostridia bacterium]
MKTVTINNELKITYPDGFVEKTEKEKSGMNFYGSIPDLCINDPEKHITVSIAYKKYGALAAALSNRKGVVKSMSKKTAALMKEFNFRPNGFITQKAGAFTADGYGYSYDAQGINMLGRSFVVKSGRTFYYIHCYYRKELEEESLKIIDGILSGNA